MATEEDVKKAIDERCEKMADVAAGDALKQEVASVCVIMECCLVAAEDLVGDTSLYQIGGEEGTTLGGRRTHDKQEIALALFDSIVKRSLMAQTQNPLQILPHIPGGTFERNF